METYAKKISLGFTSQEFEPGVHICQIFNDDEERHQALIDYVVSGIKTDEKTACFTEKESETSLKEHFAKHELNYYDLTDKGSFSLNKTEEVYFEEDRFDPDRMLHLLKQFYETAQSEQYSGARVIGEMTPKVDHVPGGSRLLEYESKVSLLLRTCPINAVCQYDAREFDGSTILDILKVHPYMIVKGHVVHNPFFEQPETYLSKHNCT